jgi:superfamily II DNA or RNA helicase
MSSSDKDHKVSVVSRYDEFQSEAVANLVDDFKEQQNGRFLLVIPTG